MTGRSADRKYFAAAGSLWRKRREINLGRRSRRRLARGRANPNQLVMRSILPLGLLNFR